MNFKLIKEPTEELFVIFKKYFLKSKPLDFCELASMQLRCLKIEEYFKDLFLYYDCFIAFKNDNIVCFFSIEKKHDAASIVIAFGLHDEITFKEISEYFINFREFYKKLNPEVRIFKGEINRAHKLNSYLKFVKRYIKPSKIELDNDKIIVYFE
jgi:hypothetical protein